MNIFDRIDGGLICCSNIKERVGYLARKRRKETNQSFIYFTEASIYRIIDEQIDILNDIKIQQMEKERGKE